MPLRFCREWLYTTSESSIGLFHAMRKGENVCTYACIRARGREEKERERERESKARSELRGNRRQQSFFLPRYNNGT